MPKKELERVGRTCPECGGELVYRNGRFGKFISCINFPTCRYTENDEEELPEEAKEEKICPNCGAKMVIKRGRYGQFWACSNYPECKTIESLKRRRNLSQQVKCVQSVDMSLSEENHVLGQLSLVVQIIQNATI